MEEDRKTAVFFDLEGTIFNGHFWQGVVKHHGEHRLKIPQVSTYIATHIPLWMAGKLRILSEEAYKIKWGEDLAIVFKGFNKEQGLSIFDWIGSNYVMKSLQTDIMALLQQHREQGHIIVLISGCFDDFLEAIKQKLNVDYVVGTRLEVVNNVYSGKIVKPLCFGINKVNMLKEFIKQKKLNIDLELSFAYSDSIMDAPLLEMVGNPVATYPDKKLLNLAKLKNWDIL